MNPAIQWLDEAKTRLEEMDYLGITPQPQPHLTTEEVYDVIREYWAQGYSVSQAFAWSIAAEQSINPFEIKKVFDELDASLEEANQRLAHDLD